MGITVRKPNIAVIMPACNAEKYLETAMRSILSQNGAELRLYVIDDGSRDATPALLEKLSREDSRLVYFTVPNGGPAAARNRGLDEALADERTEWIMFCDADDEYLPGAFQTALEGTQNASDQTDLVLMGFTIRNPDGSSNDYCEPDAVYTPDTLGAAFSDLYKANLLNQVWAKLFRASMLRQSGFRFPLYRWGEDRLFIYDCLEASRKIRIISRCGYLYKMYNSASLISGYYDKKPEVCKISDGRVRELCERFGVKDDRNCRYMFLKSVFSCLTNLYAPSCRLSDGEKREYAEKILQDEYIQERIIGTGGGRAAKLLQKVMSTRNVPLNLAAAKLMTKLSAGAPLLFQKLKHKK